MKELDKEAIKDLKQQYGTPPAFMEWMEKAVLPVYGHERFSLDTCAMAHNRKCPAFIGPIGHEDHNDMVGRDGLKASWATSGAAWCNPGFGNILPWMKKAHVEQTAGQLSVVLTHASHVAKWARYAINYATACWLINPRINFVEDILYLDHLKAQDKRPSGNNRDSMLWVFAPGDKPGSGAVFVPCDPWRTEKGVAV